MNERMSLPLAKTRSMPDEAKNPFQSQAQHQFGKMALKDDSTSLRDSDDATLAPGLDGVEGIDELYLQKHLTIV